jgi:hypothetical protein
MPAGGFITSARPNIDGQVCSVCGQIAFRIATVQMNGKETDVPICGQHYIETLRRGPAPKVAVAEGSLVPSLRSDGTQRTPQPHLALNPS